MEAADWKTEGRIWVEGTKKECVCVWLGAGGRFSARLIVFSQLLSLLKTMTTVETLLLAIMSPRLLVSNRNNRTETGSLVESGLLTGARTKRVCQKLMSELIFREQVVVLLILSLVIVVVVVK